MTDVSGATVTCPTCGTVIGVPPAPPSTFQPPPPSVTAPGPAGVLPPPPPPTAAPTGPRAVPHAARRWSVRDLLLALGVFSLVVAVISFAVVTWDDLSTLGKVALVGFLTASVAAIADQLFRRGLNATAEAVTIFLGAVLVTDIAAGRVLLFDDQPPLVVWAIGLAIAALGFVGFARLTGSRAAPVLALMAAVVPLPLLAIDAESEMLGALAGLAGAVLAFAFGPVAGRGAGQLGRFVVSGTGHLVWSFGAIGVLAGTEPLGTFGVGVILLTAIALVAVALAQADRAGTPSTFWWLTKAAGLVSLTGLGMTLRVADEEWLAVTLPVAGASILAAPIALRVRGAARARGVEGALLVGAATAALPTLALLFFAAQGIGTQIEPLADPWIGTASDSLSIDDPVFTGLLAPTMAFVILAAFGALIGILQRPLRPVLIAAFAAVAAAGPAVYGLEVSAAVVVLLAGFLTLGALAMRYPKLLIDLPFVGVGAIAVFTALATSGLTVAATAAVAVVGWVFVAAARSAPSARVLGPVVVATVGFAAAVAARADWATGDVGLVVEATAGVLSLLLITPRLGVVWGERWRLPALALEVSTLAAATVGLVLTLDGGTTGMTWGLLMAAALSAFHATRPDRQWLTVATAAFLAFAAVVQLADAEVDLLEAYVAPVAAVAAVFGWQMWRTDRTASSWLIWGPALIIAIGPSTAAALGGDAGLRPILVPVAGLALVAFGALRRLQAPVLIGATAVAVVGADQLVNLAEAVPRWISFGAVGVLLIALGADFERNRDRASKVATTVAGLH